MSVRGICALRGVMQAATCRGNRLSCATAALHNVLPVSNANACWLQVEIKSTKDTPDAGNLQKAADFVQAYILGERQTLAQACQNVEAHQHVFMYVEQPVLAYEDTPDAFNIARCNRHDTVRVFTSREHVQGCCDLIREWRPPFLSALSHRFRGG